MAPYHHSSHLSAGAGGGIGIVGLIVIVASIIFICVAISEHKKAKQLQASHNIPISWSHILGKAALYALTFGLASCLCAECCGITGDDGNAPAQQPQMDQTGDGFVSDPMMPPPQPTFQPQMDWTPVQSAAQDPVL
ncbi:hypothetical protein B7463_g5872, partial [Scytalidium lignicola]